MTKATALFYALILIAVSINTYAQQSGNYKPEYVDAKTRSANASGSSKYSDWKLYETRLIDNMTDFVPLTKSDLNKYGSQKEYKLKATGFFRTEKVKDRWWIVDAEGYLGTNVSVNAISPGASIRNKEAFNHLFKNEDLWMKNTTQELQKMGFNSSGSWSRNDLIIKNNKTEKPFVYSLNLSFMASYGKKRGGTFVVPGHTGFLGNAIFVFDPDFEKYCDEQAQKLVAYKDDPNLFGYFTDNELPFNLKNLDGYLSIKNPQDYGYQAAKKWLTDKGIEQADITDEHRKAFLAYVGDRYFSIVSKAIKKYDANHMIIGSRFYSGEKNIPEFMKAVGKYLDIVSINYYGVWTPTKSFMAKWTEWSGKPFIITEFYTKGMDSGLPNISGAGWQVKTQEDRGKAYQNFCLGLLESKNCVGWHWFKYQDNDPEDKNAEPSNRDANKGIFDNDYKAYQALVHKMQQLNINRYKLISYFDSINHEH
ncbi:hypothetical protein [Pedobacter glucosidilyticus]|uniref:hypothetical protein n=1 Tax=Pedobacter glucosidilyticus TaxID=1122941 RepID=UPI000411990D|nr:hypothetical protein [Pedobacter glucosidilyticus]